MWMLQNSWVEHQKEAEKRKRDPNPKQIEGLRDTLETCALCFLEGNI